MNPSTVPPIVLPDPETTRREDVPGVPVRLADGKTWYLASATYRHAPVWRDDPDEPVGIETTWGYPGPAQAWVDRLADAVTRDREHVPAAHIFAAAVALLRLCHQIEPSTACTLLEVSDPELTALISRLDLAVSGGVVEEET